VVIRVTLIALFGLLVFWGDGAVFGETAKTEPVTADLNLTKANLFLAAGDYRRAVEACQKEINDAPSAESYIHLTYVYHAIDAYLEHLSQEERWIAVEHLYLNLAYRDTEDLIDPPGGLARMAKEMIQSSVRQQSDVSAAMANRMDKVKSDRLWIEQAEWRMTNPKTWWQGVPTAWMR